MASNGAAYRQLRIALDKYISYHNLDCLWRPKRPHEDWHKYEASHVEAKAKEGQWNTDADQIMSFYQVQKDKKIRNKDDELLHETATQIDVFRTSVRTVEEKWNHGPDTKSVLIKMYDPDMDRTLYRPAALGLIDNDGDASIHYLGHSPGDHIFLYIHTPCLPWNDRRSWIYQGQVPYTQSTYFKRLREVVFPDVLLLLATLCGFDPQNPTFIAGGTETWLKFKDKEFWAASHLQHLADYCQRRMNGDLKNFFRATLQRAPRVREFAWLLVQLRETFKHRHLFDNIIGCLVDSEQQMRVLAGFHEYDEKQKAYRRLLEDFEGAEHYDEQDLEKYKFGYEGAHKDRYKYDDLTHTGTGVLVYTLPNHFISCSHGCQNFEDTLMSERGGVLRTDGRLVVPANHGLPVVENANAGSSTGAAWVPDIDIADQPVVHSAHAPPELNYQPGSGQQFPAHLPPCAFHQNQLVKFRPSPWGGQHHGASIHEFYNQNKHSYCIQQGFYPDERYSHIHSLPIPTDLSDTLRAIERIEDRRLRTNASNARRRAEAKAAKGQTSKAKAEPAPEPESDTESPSASPITPQQSSPDKDLLTVAPPSTSAGHTSTSTVPAKSPGAESVIIVQDGDEIPEDEKEIIVDPKPRKRSRKRKGDKDDDPDWRPQKRSRK